MANPRDIISTYVTIKTNAFFWSQRRKSNQNSILTYAFPKKLVEMRRLMGCTFFVRLLFLRSIVCLSFFLRYNLHMACSSVQASTVK